MPRSIPAAILAAAFLCGALPAQASMAVVPDDFPTLEEAIASPAETVWVRPGDYLDPLRIELDDEGVNPRSSLVLEAYPGTTHPDRPRMGRFIVLGDSHSDPVVVRGIHFADTVWFLGPEKSKLRVAIESCAFDSWLALTGARPDVRGCVMEGDVWFYYSEGGFTADTLRGGRILVEGQDVFGVARCLFDGPGTVAVEVNGNDTNFGFVESVIRGYERGIDSSTPDQPQWIADSRFEDCGIAVAIRNAYQCHVLRNQVLRCGTGIHVQPSDALTILENRVTQCTGSGIVAQLREGEALISRNVVGSCGGDGIVLSQSEWTRAMLVSNTCYSNGGSGFSVGRASEEWSASVTQVTANIAYANGGHGLEVDLVDDLLTLGCNDWFANVLGAVSGTSPGATDLALDPLFCDVASGDVHLRSTSPLLAVPGCEAIGALGPGCADAPTATLVLAFTAERVADGVRLHGRLSAPPMDAITIERSEGGEGPWWAVVAERSARGEEILALDRGAAADRAYDYRLVAQEGGRSVILAGPVRVAAAADAAFALLPASPNPSRGPVQLGFTLPRPAAIALEVFDLQGRLVASLARGTHAAGSHRVAWAGQRGDGEPAAPGIYLVRFRHPYGEALQRLVRLD